jgi:hypothetical protein
VFVVACSKITLSGGKAPGHHLDDTSHVAGLNLSPIKMLLQPVGNGARILQRQGAYGRFDFGNCTHASKLAASGAPGKQRFPICQPRQFQGYCPPFFMGIL